MSEDRPEFSLLDKIWPKKLKGRRNYRYEIIKELSKLEMKELGRRVQQRITSKSDSKARLANRRLAKRIIRRMKSKPGSSSRFPVSKTLLVGRKRACEILDALYPKRKSNWLMPSRRSRKSVFELQNFSLLDNPRYVFERLEELAEAEAQSCSVILNFNDVYCLDLSAYLLLGILSQKMLGVVTGGSITPAVRSMMRAVNLDTYLGVNVDTTKYDPSFMPFKLRYRRAVGSSTSKNTAFQPSSAEKLADDLVETIERWLLSCARPPLSNDMKGYVCSLVTEVLDNAVRHSDLTGSDGDWAMAGFLSFVREEARPNFVSFFCSLSMISLGATIYESLSACSDPAMAQQLHNYVHKHQNKAAGRATPVEAECLTNVYALQDGVSRFAQAHDASRGGVGLMDTVQFMNDISSASVDSEEPCMTLISGHSCIQIRGAYRNAFDRRADQRRNLWFNPGNTLEKPPDHKYVQTLQRRFPGTIVALRFCLGSEELEKLTVSGL